MIAIEINKSVFDLTQPFEKNLVFMLQICIISLATSFWPENLKYLTLQFTNFDFIFIYKFPAFATAK